MGKPMTQIAIFVGPTGYSLGSRLDNLDPTRYVRFGPISRGDIAALHTRFDTVVIVDGYFDSVPAVGHREIREALATRRIIGCSSMGAIRACEMRSFGVRGFGAVYEMFVADPFLSDDEVALLHGPGPRYLPISEPLVNIRHILTVMTEDGRITADIAECLVTEMRGIYFGDRTVDALHKRLSALAGDAPADWAVAQLRTHGVKTDDLSRLLYLLDREAEVAELLL